MKNTLIFIMLISLTACFKPTLLKSDIPIVSNTDYPCILFNQTLDDRQIAHATYKQEKVYYFYDLSEFVGDLKQNNCQKPMAQIIKINVIVGFVTVRAAVSLNRFQIEATVEIYNHDNSMNEKTYKTESDSETLFFLASNKQQYQQDSVALRKGLKNILDQIASDLKNANEHR